MGWCNVSDTTRNDEEQQRLDAWVARCLAGWSGLDDPARERLALAWRSAQDSKQFASNSKQLQTVKPAVTDSDGEAVP